MIKYKSGHTLAQKLAADNAMAKEARYQTYMAKQKAQEKAMAEAVANGTDPNAKLNAEVKAMLDAIYAPMIAKQVADDATWRDIPGFENYQIRADGAVSRKHYKRVFKDSLRFVKPRTRYYPQRLLATYMVNGHRAVSVKVKGKVKKIYVDATIKAVFAEVHV